MECKDCPYYEKWDGEKYPHCHFEDITGEDMSWLNVPPCEES